MSKIIYFTLILIFTILISNQKSFSQINPELLRNYEKGVLKLPNSELDKIPRSRSGDTLMVPGERLTQSPYSVDKLMTPSTISPQIQNISQPLKINLSKETWAIINYTTEKFSIRIYNEGSGQDVNISPKEAYIFTCKSCSTTVRYKYDNGKGQTIEGEITESKPMVIDYHSMIGFFAKK